VYNSIIHRSLNYRQYHTKNSASDLLWGFRQVEQKFGLHIAVSQGIFGQDDGNNAATIMRSAADGLYAA